MLDGGFIVDTVYLISSTTVQCAANFNEPLLVLSEKPIKKVNECPFPCLILTQKLLTSLSKSELVVCDPKDERSFLIQMNEARSMTPNTKLIIQLP